jgi:hypothetical protein
MPLTHQYLSKILIPQGHIDSFLVEGQTQNSPRRRIDVLRMLPRIKTCADFFEHSGSLVFCDLGEVRWMADWQRWTRQEQGANIEYLSQ